VEDFLEYLIEDPATTVITLVVEQFRDPMRFLDLAERARTCGSGWRCCIPAAAAPPALPPRLTRAPWRAITR
jgi:hypothetical protein